jgi:hypothetical protein
MLFTTTMRAGPLDHLATLLCIYSIDQTVRSRTCHILCGSETTNIHPGITSCEKFIRDIQSEIVERVATGNGGALISHSKTTNVLPSGFLLLFAASLASPPKGAGLLTATLLAGFSFFARCRFDSPQPASKQNTQIKKM